MSAPAAKAKKAPEFPPGYVMETSRGSHMVRSRTIDGAWWAVMNNRCSCPARVARCWHVQRVEAFVAAMEKPVPRPLGLVKPALFCD